MDLSQVDYSKLSDEALEQLSKGGAKTDFSKWNEADLQVLAKGPDADKGFGPTADGSMRKAKDVNWLGAIVQEITEGRPDVQSMSVTKNPILAAGPPAGVVPLVGAGPSVLSPVGRMAWAVRSKVAQQAPEVAKDLGTFLAGEAFDRASGNNSGKIGIGAALARRFGRFVK